MCDRRYTEDLEFLRSATQEGGECLREGVMDYKHTPANLQSIASRNPPQTRPAAVSDDDYLRKHGARLAPQTDEDVLIPAPPDADDIAREHQAELDYYKKFGHSPADTEEASDEEDYEDEDEEYEDEEDSLRIEIDPEEERQIELQTPGNVDFYYNSMALKMPVARALAMSADKKYVFIKYVDYFDPNPSATPLTFAVVPVTRIKILQRGRDWVVGIPEGGNAYIAYGTLDAQGNIQELETYGAEGDKAIRLAVNKGLLPSPT